MFFFILGTMYQASVEYNMNISLYPNSHYNPNEPQGFYDQNRTYFGEVSFVRHLVSSVYSSALLFFTFLETNHKLETI
jgi:hypothetical protein